MKPSYSKPLYSKPVLLALFLSAGCANLHDRSLVNAWTHWQQGDRTASLALSKQELHRYLDANNLSPRRVQTEASLAYDAVDQSLIVVNLREKKPRAVGLVEKRPDALTLELRKDLGADDCLPVMRAIQTVRSLRLKEHALPLMAVVFRRQPYKDAHGIFGAKSTALRSVSVKWAAFETLRSFDLSTPD